MPGDVYGHYKGGVYEVITMATHTETQEQMVVYRSLVFGTIYVRPYSVWREAKDGQPRFEKIPKEYINLWKETMSTKQ